MIVRLTLFLTVILSARSATAEEVVLGPWGEDPRVVPSFVSTEERRAPKVPTGDKLWREFQTAHVYERIDGGLLVCQLQVGKHQGAMSRAATGILTFGLSELASVNITLKLKLRADPTIVLWGPVKHDNCFVSIPAISLARGDRMEMTLLDRGIASTRKLGTARLPWDGGSPLRFSTSRWTAHCTLLDGEEARARAAPWIASLDRQLEEIAAAKIDRAEWDFGRPTRRIDQLAGSFRELFTGEGNFRYAAGFLGWGHPEIQTRLARFNHLVKAFDEAIEREVEIIVKEVLHVPLLAGSGTVLITSPGKGAPTTIEVSNKKDLDCAALQTMIGEVSLIDEHGRFSSIHATLKDANGHVCDESTPNGMLHPPLHGTVRPLEPPLPRIRLARTRGHLYARVE